MRGEILSTGEEIRSGELIDSNSSHIAIKLEEAGVYITRHTCVGDEVKELVKAIKEMASHSDIGIITGGLGPTDDDLTTEAAAAAAGVKLVLDQKALVMIENFFKSRNLEMTDSNIKQAMLPEGADTMYNPVGTAPGFHIKTGKCDLFFLPGVPHEMRRMLKESVLPEIDAIIEKTPGKKKLCLIKHISTFGITESGLNEKLSGFYKKFPDINIGLRAKFPQINIKLYSRKENMENLMEKGSAWIQKKIGNKIFSLDGKSMETVVGEALCKKKATLAVAESCTGGLIANLLTDVPGSSDYFLFSGVTYSNKAKINILGVSEDTINRYGAVHEKTAIEMANGAKRIAGAAYGLSTSGIAGPGGGTEKKPVGTVCIGLAAPDYAKAYTFNMSFGQRSRNKKIFAMKALDLLRHEL